MGFFDGGGAGDDGAGDGSSARSPLRDARSSLVWLAEALGAASTCAETAGVSVAGPRVIAAAEAPRTTPAIVRAAMSGTDRRGRNRVRRVIRVEKPRGAGRDVPESACLPDKIEPFVGDKAGADAIDIRS